MATSVGVSEGLLLAGKRPFWIASGLACLDLGSLGHFQGIFDLDTQIPDSAFQLAVTQ